MQKIEFKTSETREYLKLLDNRRNLDFRKTFIIKGYLMYCAIDKKDPRFSCCMGFR